MFYCHYLLSLTMSNFLGFKIMHSLKGLLPIHIQNSGLEKNYIIEHGHNKKKILAEDFFSN